jgi:hypothetical protein
VSNPSTDFGLFNSISGSWAVWLIKEFKEVIPGAIITPKVSPVSATQLAVRLSEINNDLFPVGIKIMRQQG